MPDAQAPEAGPGGLPFDEAIAFLKQKVNLPTRRWTDLWEGMHARAFVVAGAMRDDLLVDLQAALVKAIRDGTTLQQFRKDFLAIVHAHGWTGWTGEGTAQGRAWRARVIYDTNLRMAYAAGRWEQIQRTKAARPYLRYSAVMDGRTRPQHAAWHGTVLPADDPWWSSHYPPNGWYCRCTVIQLSARDLERQGWQVSDQAPPSPMVARDIPGRGKVETPEGIDPGFGHNIGEAAWGRNRQIVAMERSGPMVELAVGGDATPDEPRRLTAEPPRASLGPRVGTEAALREALRTSIGGDERIFRDPAGGRVLVTQAIVDHMLEDAKRRDGREAYFPLIPELVEDPQEIWVGFAASSVSGRVTLRRRYVKLLSLGKDRSLALVADAEGGIWVSLTFLRGKPEYLQRLRTGLRVYAR